MDTAFNVGFLASLNVNQELAGINRQNPPALIARTGVNRENRRELIARTGE